MKKTALLFLAALAVAASAATTAPDDGELAATMRAMFLSQAGENLRAAAAFAELAETLGDPALMREAYRDAIGARNPTAALQYVRRWSAMGGGAEALRAESHLLLALGRGGEASPALFAFKAQGAENEDLFRLLINGQKKDALPLGRKLLDDSAEGNLFKAKLAMHFGVQSAAENAIARGLSQSTTTPYLAELHFTHIQIAAGLSQDYTIAAPLLDNYIAQECPGADTACSEAEIVYAFALFIDGREWKIAPGEDADAAALAAGRFFERAEMPARANPHYARLRGRFFHADLGLARIARDAGRLTEALTILDSAPVASDNEFALRETTAVDITHDLHGVEAALTRIVRARQTSPENHELLYEHSLLAEQSGDVPTAVALLEYMTTLFPNTSDSWNALGYVLAEHNLRLDEAEKFIKKALSISPDLANILDSLGWVYYRQGRLDEALKYLLQAAAKSSSAEISAHLGEVYWQRGEYELARGAFAEGKQREPENKVLNETLQRLQISN